MTYPPRHYPTPAAKCADLVVHISGLVLALFGGGILLGLGVSRGSLGMVAAVSIYAAGLVAMLGLSTAYNFGKPQWRPLLRRFDHAGIFLMIAGSYTPFTTQSLTGAWSIAMTATVWGASLLGIFGKLFLPGLGRGFWVVLYLVLGWAVVFAIQPMLQGVHWVAMLLLAIGGLVYSAGAVFYMMKRLRFRRAIWHGHVVAGAGLQYAAVLVGVVLAGAHN
ncbi:MAG: hemolysin III family protein [Caulobacterales bacterium]|mgnify:CR=1 FL=1|nr:hemolysin III family protein [Caulobacterales bacterium]